jgi:hypothetical protein
MPIGHAGEKTIWKSPSLIQIRKEQKALEEEAARMKSYGRFNQAGSLPPVLYLPESECPTKPPPSYNAYRPSSRKKTRSDNSSGQSSGKSSIKTNATTTNTSTVPGKELDVPRETLPPSEESPLGELGMKSFHNRSQFLQERTILYAQLDLLRKEFEDAICSVTPDPDASAFTTVIVMTACINSIATLVFEFNRVVGTFCQTWGRYVQPLEGDDPLIKILRGKPALFLCKNHPCHIVVVGSVEECVHSWEETWVEFLREFQDVLDVGDVCAVNEFIKRALSRLVSIKAQTEKFLEGGRKSGSMMRMGIKKTDCERRREQEKGLKEAEEVKRKVEGVRSRFTKGKCVEASEPRTA